jgi:hypothetical protein
MGWARPHGKRRRGRKGRLGLGCKGKKRKGKKEGVGWAYLEKRGSKRIAFKCTKPIVPYISF